jgi:hypothetical protein
VEIVDDFNFILGKFKSILIDFMLILSNINTILKDVIAIYEILTNYYSRYQDNTKNFNNVSNFPL